MKYRVYGPIKFEQIVIFMSIIIIIIIIIIIMIIMNMNMNMNMRALGTAGYPSHLGLDHELSCLNVFTKRVTRVSRGTAG